MVGEMRSSGGAAGGITIGNAGCGQQCLAQVICIGQRRYSCTLLYRQRHHDAAYALRRRRIQAACRLQGRERCVAEDDNVCRLARRRLEHTVAQRADGVVVGAQRVAGRLLEERRQCIHRMLCSTGGKYPHLVGACQRRRNRDHQSDEVLQLVHALNYRGGQVLCDFSLLFRRCRWANLLRLNALNIFQGVQHVQGR